MSDEYRRVLHEWARTLLPADIGDVPIVDVKLETSAGRVWSTITVEDPVFQVKVFYLANGSEQTHWASTDLEDGGMVMSKLLGELFRIAHIQDQVEQSVCVCGHDFYNHDTPDWFQDSPPNPLWCPVDGCDCKDPVLPGEVANTEEARP